MEKDYSFKALMEFIQSAGARGDLAKTTSNNQRKAVSSVLSDLSETESIDVRTIDIDLAVVRYNNRATKKLSSETLMTYKSRIESAIRDFARYTENPLKYKPVKTELTGSKPKRSNDPKNVEKSERQNVVNENNSQALNTSETLPPAQKPSLNLNLRHYEFPLRYDLRIPIAVPDDLTIEDVERISNFLHSLVLPV